MSHRRSEDIEIERLRQFTAHGDAAAAWRLRQLALRHDDDALFVEAAHALGDIDGITQRALRLWSIGAGDRVPALLSDVGLMLDDDMLSALSVLLHTVNGRRRSGRVELDALLGCLVEARTNALGYALVHGGARASGSGVTTLCLAARVPIERATHVVAQVEVVDARTPCPPPLWFETPWSPDLRENVDAVQQWASVCSETLDTSTFDTLVRPVIVPTVAAAPLTALTRPLATRVLDLLRASDGESWSEHDARPEVLLEGLRTLVAERFRDRPLVVSHATVRAVDEATSRFARHHDAREHARALRLDVLPAFRDDGPLWLERTLASFGADEVLAELTRRLADGRFTRPVELGTAVPPMRLSSLLNTAVALTGAAAVPLLRAAAEHPRPHVRRHARQLLDRLAHRAALDRGDG